MIKSKPPMKTNPSKSDTTKKPGKNLLLIEFSVLSFIAFVIIGYTVISVIRPALEGFTIREERDATVIFVNRNANQILSEDDFIHPLTDEQKLNMEKFISRLSIRGILRIFITDSAGTVVYSQPQEYIGSSFADNPDVQFAIERRRPAAHFESISPADQKTLGVKDALIQAVPVTFGASEDVTGVVYIISRVGLLKKQIQETQESIAMRISGGLLLLYALLFVIVWRASTTIRNQAGELASYARTLEQRVRERTKKLEESTERQLKQAEELSRLKDEFVFVATHELRSPITGLKWILERFFDSPLSKKASPTLHEIMGDIQEISNRLGRLVSDLLDVARLEKGTIKISVHPTDLISAVQEMVLQFKPEAEHAGILLKFEYDSKQKFPFAMSDSEKLKEIFSNLFSNAIKFNTRGGEVTASVVQEGSFLRARVSDTGVGMTQEEIKKLFTKFGRFHPEITGTGLGLWITKQLVERMKGKIEVESKKGEGTTFSVILPIAKGYGIKDGHKPPRSKTKTPKQH